MPGDRNTAQMLSSALRIVQNGSVNKRDLAKAIAVHADVDLATVSKILDGFTEVVTSVVSKGESVLVTGFAKFSKVERAARMGRNPATGEQIHIKASKRARITPAKTFKDAVLTPASAPKLGRGVWPVDPEAVKRAGRSAEAPTPAKRAAASKPVSRRGPARKKAVAKRAPARKSAVAKRTSPAKKATARKTTARKVTARKTTARKTVARKVTARTATARKVTGGRKTTVKKATSRRSPARKTAAARSLAPHMCAARHCARLTVEQVEQQVKQQ